MMNSKFYLATSALVALLSSACAQKQETVHVRAESAKIIAGEESVKEDSWTKSVAAIVLKRDGKEIFCSGTILEKNMILTSAHCVENFVPQEISVVFGTNANEAMVNQSSMVFPADTIRINPAYREGNAKDLIANFDLAIIKIRGEIPEGYKPLARIQTLENSEFHIWPGQEVRLVGYGVNSFNKVKDGSSASGAGILRFIDKVIAADGKREAWTGIFGNNKQGACWADMGGPAMINYRGNWLLWGVISAPRAGKNGAPTCQHGVYATKVAHWDDWILDTVEELSEVR